MWAARQRRQMPETGADLGRELTLTAPPPFDAEPGFVENTRVGDQAEEDSVTSGTQLALYAASSQSASVRNRPYGDP